MKKVYYRLLVLGILILSLLTLVACFEDSTTTTPQNTSCEHEWQTTLLLDADCTTDGKETQTCALCGMTRSISLAATGHEWIVVEETAPTCEKSGKTVYECKNCSQTKDEITLALNHDFDDYGVCKNCGKNIRKEALIAYGDIKFHNHDYGVYVNLTMTYNEAEDLFAVKQTMDIANTTYTYNFKFGDYYNGSGTYKSSIGYAPYGVSYNAKFSVKSNGITYSVSSDVPSINKQIMSAFDLATTALNDTIYAQLGFYLTK